MPKPRLIVVTGGPGAGKTAALELARRIFEKRATVLPEAASILFSGGFPRGPSTLERKAVQSAIFHVQNELEALAQEQGGAPNVLCDRGTLDGLAYWPGDEKEFFARTRSTRRAELARYYGVIHLRTPSEQLGYNRSNPVRIETAAQAAELDARIEAAWEGHPRRRFIDGTADFFEKVGAAIAEIDAWLTPASEWINFRYGTLP